MNNTKAAIFDLDGTIIDSMYVWEKIDVDFLTERNLPVTKEYTEKMRGMFFENAAAYTVEKYNLKETPEEIVKIWLEMARHEYENNVKAKPNVHRYLSNLKSQKVKIGMATSSNPYLLEPVLKSNGLDSYFDTICYTSEVGRNKSHPDIYLHTAEKLGVLPQHCVVFEDIIEGIKGANKADMKTVAIYDKASEDSVNTLKENADKFIYGFDELLGVDVWTEIE